MNASSWSKLGSKYNSASGESMTLGVIYAAFEQFWFPKMDETLRARKDQSPLKVLALACGTGAEVEVMCSRYDKDQVSILATDYAEGMVEAAKETIKRIGAQDRVNVQAMDAMKIEHPDSSFDIVTLVLGPMLMPDPPQVFREIQRVLVPGGWSAYLTPNRMDTHDIFVASKREVLEKANRSHTFKDFYKLPMMQEWGSPEALTSKLKAANFSQVESRHIESHLKVERGQGIDDLLSRLFENPGMSQLYEGDLSAEESQEFRKLSSERFHAKFPSSITDSPASVYISTNAGIGFKGK